jgi:hypothetical protein
LHVLVALPAVRPGGGGLGAEPPERAALGKYTNNVASALGPAWKAAVLRVMGEAHVPDDIHGIDVKRYEHGVDPYITNLGWELTDGTYKTSKKGNMALGELAKQAAYDAAYPVKGYKDHRLVWHGWARDIKGARHLTWSTKNRDLRRIYKDTDRTDEQICDDSEDAGTCVALLRPCAWRKVSPIELLDAADAEKLTDYMVRSGCRCVQDCLPALPGVLVWDSS